MLLYIIFIYLFYTINCEGWSYNDKANWASSFPQCGGQLQSPINIDKRTVRYAPFGFFIDNYDRTYNLRVQNNGDTAVLTFANTGGNRPSLQFDDHKYNSPRYILENVHVHWGKSYLQGSEHSIDNQFAAAELHFVHYNQKYGNFQDAVTQSDGLVVASVLMALTYNPNNNLDWLIGAVKHINPYNSTVYISSNSNFYLDNLLPRDRRSVFRYRGSLTTPPCYESVTWLVFETPINICRDQLNQFRQLREKSTNNESGHPLLDNRRSIQSNNDRIVQSSNPKYQ
ncbi:carbonic anhydrase 2-like [Oppia nitens]|uniref:carbonic anhydrase 2-like n=1 Tax=Oppia nitens TaxID=1686743 RepID=UPI0023DC4421|nr:carbonic anhydrase 2-like [Oppia nitens]